MPSYLRQKIIAIGFSLLLFLGWYGLSLYMTIDTDFGWHYRCGQEFIDTGKWCHVNHYSYLFPNYYWGYSTLIYDVILVLIYKLAGFIGVMHFGAFIMALFYLLMYKRYGKSVLVSFWIFLLGALATLEGGFRAQVFTLAFAGLFWVLLPLNNLTKRKELLHNLAIVGLFTIWANTHPGVVLFVAIYGLFCTLKIISRKYNYLGFALLAVLASLLTPQGLSLYMEALFHYQTDLSKLIVEWTRPTVFDRTLIIFSAALAGILIASQFRALRFKSVFLGLILLLMTILTLNAQRQIPLYTLLLLIIVEEFSLVERILRWLRLRESLVTQTMTIILLSLSFLNWQHVGVVRNRLEWYCKYAFVQLPCQAVHKVTNLGERLFTAYEWGGFLIWQRPEVKVYVDGRMPAWRTPSGESPYTTYLNVIQAKKGWNESLKKSGTDALLIPAKSYLDLAIEASSSGWIENYRDSMSVYYSRDKSTL